MEYLLLGLTALAVPVLGVWGFFRTLSLATRADQLAARIAQLEARIAAADIPLAAAPSSAADTGRAEQAAAPDAVSEPIPPETGATAEPAGPAEPTSEPLVTDTPVPANLPVAARSLEETIGTRWVVWVGGIVLALGGVFLVRYSIEQGWFGPAARVFSGALFALALLAVGESMRRRERAGGQLPRIGDLAPAHIPSVLTAAGTMAAFATVYAAHALYGFIGPAIAFALLAIIGIGTMAAAALHGPTLAALGLLGSLAAPLLVSSSGSGPWPAVIHLFVVVASAYGLARIRGWLWLALAAASGALCWGLALVGTLPDAQLTAAMAFLLSQAGLAAAVFVFAAHRDDEELPALPDAAASGVLAGFAALSVLLLLHGIGAAGAAAFSALMAVMLAGSALLVPAAAPVALLAPAVVAAALFGWPVAAELARDGANVLPGRPGGVPLPDAIWFFGVFAALAGASLAAAGWLRLMRAATLPRFASASYVAMGVLAPLAFLVVAWWRLNQFNSSLPFGLVAIIIALVMAAAATLLQRQALLAEPATEDPAQPPPALFGLEGFAAGALGAMALGLAMILDKGSLTVALALAALGAAWVTTRTGLGLLRRMVGALGVVVLARLIEDPTLVGGDLGGIPIFNWLLWGYGVPAVSFGVASVLLRRQKDDEVVAICEGLAMALSFFLVAFEIRHLLTGGIDGPVVTHLEAGLHVFASLVFALVIVRLETVRRSAVLRIGSYVFGGLSLVGGVFGLVLMANPLFGGGNVQGGALLNSLLLGYLLPAVAAFALARTARERRPRWFVMAAAALGFVLQFVYTIAEIRHLFRGPNISLFRTTSDAELYTYSIVFLVVGVVLLGVGIVRQSRTVRLVSGGYVLLAVGKAFLVDMSGLSGGLRALSFIGLGLALVGIGLVYQKLVFAPRGAPTQPTAPPSPPESETEPPPATA